MLERSHPLSRRLAIDHHPARPMAWNSIHGNQLESLLIRTMALLSDQRHKYSNVLLATGEIFGYVFPNNVPGSNHAEKKSVRDHAHQ